MKAINESEKISLAECRKILSKEGKCYTDAEILIIRNWLYRFSEITLNFLHNKSKEEIKRIKEILRLKSKTKK